MGKRGPVKSTSDFKQHIGNIELQKGQTKEGIPVVTWDAVPQCEADACPINTLCPYEKAGKCRVRKEYITYVQSLLFGQVDKENQMARFRIGMEILPLFLQLITLKIHSHGSLVTYIDNRGSIRMNPIHKELRSCIKAINEAFKGIEVAFEGKKVGGVDSLLGDGDWYDGLFEGEPEEESFKMRNRV